MGWPPNLAELKEDMNKDQNETRDDVRLQTQLDAAVAFVERVRKGSFNFAGDPVSTLPAPTKDIELGTKRLAARWYIRNRSPDMLIDMGDLGQGRVPSFDPDIDRLLGIGRHRGPVFA